MTLPAWAFRGARVVCIKACDDGPALRERCVISEVIDDARGPFAPYAYIEGYDGWIAVSESKRKRTGYSVWHFRPLVTRSQEQDMAIFRPILDQVPVEA